MAPYGHKMWVDGGSKFCGSNDIWRWCGDCLVYSDCMKCYEPETHGVLPTRFRENDVPNQLCAGIFAGGCMGAMWGFGVTFNCRSEEMIYARPFWPRWKHVRHERYGYILSEIARYAMVAGAYAGSFALVDGMVANYRRKEDWINPVIGGIASSYVGHMIRGGDPFRNVVIGMMWCALVWGKRIGYNRVDEDKLTFAWQNLWGIKEPLPMYCFPDGYGDDWNRPVFNRGV